MRTKWITLVGLLALLSLIALVVIRSGVISFHEASTTKERPFDLRTFTALPYTNFVVEPEERKQKTGVTLYDEARSYPGLNLYSNHYSKISHKLTNPLKHCIRPVLQ